MHEEFIVLKQIILWIYSYWLSSHCIATKWTIVGLHIKKVKWPCSSQRLFCV